MKKEIGDIWKDKNEWIVQFPKGRLNFKTKRVALQWQKFLKNTKKIKEVN